MERGAGRVRGGRGRGGGGRVTGERRTACSECGQPLPLRVDPYTGRVVFVSRCEPCQDRDTFGAFA
jgi:hypothetical protein